VERVPGLAQPLVTVIGWCDGRYISERTEMAGTSPAKVRAWVDSLLVLDRTKPAKVRSRGVAGPA